MIFYSNQWKYLCGVNYAQISANTACKILNKDPTSIALSFNKAKQCPNDNRVNPDFWNKKIACVGKYFINKNF